LRRRLLTSVILVQIILVAAVSSVLALPLSLNFNQTGSDTTQPVGTEWGRAMLALGAGLAVGLGCLGAGIAIAASGSAAISAATEKPETFFRSFLIVALGEALGIYGLIVGILLWLKI